MEFELKVIRQVYFYETVCGPFESFTLGEMLSTNVEMRDIDEFSKWIDNDSDGLDEFENWLSKNFLNEDYPLDKLYKPSK